MLAAAPIVRLAVAIGLTVATASCGVAPGRDQPAAQLQQHPARQLSTWSDWIAKPTEQRIAPAPPVVLDYLRKDNEQQGWPERPDATDIAPAFIADVAAAIAGMPAIVRRHYTEHAVGVFLVRNLGGTAYGEMLRDYATNRRGFIVLDVGSLDRAANDWATWKERSPFSDNTTMQIEANIEHAASNTRTQAIQYILLHEIAHLVGAVYRQHPDFNNVEDPAKYPYSALSWRADGDRMVSRREKTFPLRGKIAYYKFAAAPLKSADIENVYRQFAQSDFVSLYAATNMFDDFAETYAMYVHVVLQRKPWQLRIRQGDRVVMQIDRPILDERCRHKLEYFEKFLGRDPPDGRP